MTEITGVSLPRHHNAKDNQVVGALYDKPEKTYAEQPEVSTNHQAVGKSNRQKEKAPVTRRLFLVLFL